MIFSFIVFSVGFSVGVALGVTTARLWLAMFDDGDDDVRW